MATPRSRVTEKGQVTIPVEMRRELGIAASDSVTFTLRGSVIELRRAPNIEEFLGSISPIRQPEDFDALEAAYEQDIVDDVMESLRRSASPER
jgi:AbrB family looped-hinge helix DNA binding protein